MFFIDTARCRTLLRRRSHNRSIARTIENSHARPLRRVASRSEVQRLLALNFFRCGCRDGAVSSLDENCETVRSAVCHTTRLCSASHCHRSTSTCVCVCVWRFVKLHPATQMPSKDHRRDFRQPRDRFNVNLLKRSR